MVLWVPWIVWTMPTNLKYFVFGPRCVASVALPSRQGGLLLQVVLHVFLFVSSFLHFSEFCCVFNLCYFESCCFELPALGWKGIPWMHIVCVVCKPTEVSQPKSAPSTKPLPTSHWHILIRTTTPTFFFPPTYTNKNTILVEPLQGLWPATKPPRVSAHRSGLS